MGRHEIIGADGRVMVVDDNGYVLRDGEKLRVPMQFRDSMSPVQKAVADASVRFDDGGGGRPGTQFDFAAAHAVKEAARNEMIADMVDAWKAPPVADARRRRRSGVVRDPQGRELSSWEEHLEEDDAVPGSAKPGDVCMTDNHEPGHINAAGKCIADTRPHDAQPRTMTADEARPIRDAAYLEFVRSLENGWKGDQT